MVFFFSDGLPTASSPHNLEHRAPIVSYEHGVFESTAGVVVLEGTLEKGVTVFVQHPPTTAAVSGTSSK